MPNIFKFVKKHKILSSVAAAVLAIGGYYGFSAFTGSSTQTRYVLSAAENGSIITVVSGSGQVSASKQVDIKATVSGDVVYANATVGQEVKKGQLIAQLDTTSAQKTVKDAETSLESAKLSLEQLQQPAEELTILQAENSLSQAYQTKEDAENNLEKSYQDGISAIETIFTGLPNLMVGLKDAVIGTSYQNNINYYVNAGKDYDANMAQYGERAFASYEKAAEEYENNFNHYLTVNRSSDGDEIYLLIGETAACLSDVSTAIKDDASLISHLYDVVPSTQEQAVSDANLTVLNAYAATIKVYLASAIAAKNSIETYERSVSNADWTITEKTASLANLKEGPDELQVRAQNISIGQREDALADAKEKLSDYYIRAPFDGVIAAMNVSQGDSIASISSYGTIATIITKNRVAEISMNEVDAATVKTGQKATLEFDAVDGLTITGTISEIDTIGTVSQNVVTYSAKIVFDTEDERIKPGMSVTASIITESKQDLLLVPSAAVKNSGDTYYVEVVDSGSVSGQDAISTAGVVLKTGPVKKTVEVGSSDDTMVEITSGISEGDLVVIKTVVQTVKAGSQAQGLFSMPGRNSSKSSSSSTKSGSSSGGVMNSGNMMTPPSGGAGPGM
ncbi:MAG: efflux RND transporter periplasmic adaptor subunit [Candidatus Paceibacterota bacterium]|jgi:HlyD family secretion protein